MGTLAYSSDGHYLASLSSTSLIIWDIQTGGVAMEILCDETPWNFLVWSSDGRTVSTMDRDETIYTYDIISGTRLTPGRLCPRSILYLWAHNTSLRAMTIQGDAQTYRINILEVGCVVTEVETFYINSRAKYAWVEFFLGKDPYRIMDFSPTTYYMSMACSDMLLVLDIRDSRSLLKQKGNSHSHCFSSDGSLFVASLDHWNVHVWKYDSSHYTPWREFPSFNCLSPCFSPNLSSILSRSYVTLQVLPLDDPPIVGCPKHCRPLATPSSCGTYVVTGCIGDHTITITNLLSQTPSYSIDIGMRIEMFALTGNVLLVAGSKTIAAWQVAEKGVVGFFGNGTASHHNRIWTIQQPPTQLFVVEDQTVTICDKVEKKPLHVYHTGTGEVLKPTQALPPNAETWTLHSLHYGYHYPNHQEPLDRDSDSPSLVSTPPNGWWFIDPEGKHLLWAPIEWRNPYNPHWFYDIKTLWFDHCGSNLEEIIIKF